MKTVCQLSRTLVDLGFKEIMQVPSIYSLYHINIDL